MEKSVGVFRPCSENISNAILNMHSYALPQQRNHNKLFIILQIFIILPISLILMFLIYKIKSTNKALISQLCSISEKEIENVEKKYQKYFNLKNKTLDSNFIKIYFLDKFLDIIFITKQYKPLINL